MLRKPFANKWLNLAVLWGGAALLVVIVYVPFLQRLAHSAPISCR